MRLVGVSEAAASLDLALDQGTITVGSDPGNTVVIEVPDVDDHHLRLRHRGRDWTLEPFRPGQIVCLNGIRVIGPHSLRVGDEIEFGSARLALAAEPGEERRQAPRRALNRKAWLGASTGLVFALIIAIAALQTLPRGIEPPTALGAALAPTVTAAPSATSAPTETAAPPTATPMAPPTSTLPATRAPVAPTAGATPVVDSDLATLEAALGPAPHQRAVTAMTAIAVMPSPLRQQALRDLAALSDGQVESWIDSLLGTPTPVPPTGRLVFGRYSPGFGRYDVVSRDLLSGLETVLLTQGSQPAFSADGRMFAYHSWQPDALGLYAATADGSARWLLTRDSHDEDRLPAWSPDNALVAFASFRLSDGMSRIYSVPAQGGLARDITYGEYVSWSPDGSRIAIKGCVGGSCGIMLATPDGEDLTFLTTDATDGAPAWSPDGTRIAFHSHRQDDNWDLYVMNRDGTDIRRLTDSAMTDCTPVWSPDGRYLAFRSNRDAQWALWVVPSEGGEPALLFPADLRPGDELIECIAWLP